LHLHSFSINKYGWEECRKIRKREAENETRLAAIEFAETCTSETVENSKNVQEHELEVEVEPQTSSENHNACKLVILYQ